MANAERSLSELKFQPSFSAHLYALTKAPELTFTQIITHVGGLGNFVSTKEEHIKYSTIANYFQELMASYLEYGTKCYEEANAFATHLGSTLLRCKSVRMIILASAPITKPDHPDHHIWQAIKQKTHEIRAIAKAFKKC